MSERRAVTRKHALGLGAAALAEASRLLDAPAASAAAPAEVTLSMWTTDHRSIDFFTARAKEWEKQYPRYRLHYNFLHLPYEEMFDKVLAALSAGKGAPDLIGLERNAFSRFMKDGIATNGLVDLTPRIGQQRGEFAEASWASYMLDGRIYGVESALCPVGLYYRKDLLDAAGIKTPLKTYDDLLAAGRILAKQDTYICLAEKTPRPALGPIVFIELFGQQGGLLFDGSGALKLDDPRAVRALTYLVNAANQKLFWTPPDMLGAQTIAEIKTGRVATVLMPDWYAKELIEAKMPELAGKWRLQNLPTWDAGGSQVSAYGGTGFAIAKQSKFGDLAWSLLRYAYLTERNQVKRFAQNGYFPTMKTAFLDPGVIGFQEPYFGGQEVGGTWAQVAPQVPAMYQSPFWAEALAALATEYAKAMNGTKAPAAAIKDASATISQAMARTA